MKTLTGIQLAYASKYFNDEWDGVEWCPYCNKEFDFVVNPMKSVVVKCTHCGEEQHPCSLCSGMKCGEYKTCKEAIIAELCDWNLGIDK